MGMSVKGQVTQICDVQTGQSKTGKEWSKQEFVIDTAEQFSKKICFTVMGDKISMLNGVNNGAEVEVAFNLESRDFNGKWYHNINAWKIDVLSANNSGTGLTSAGSIQPPTANELAPDDSDLPF